MILDRVTLPLPPSINNYYKRRVGGGVRVDDKVVEFRGAVAVAVYGIKASTNDRLGLVVGLSFPNNRKQDIDNRIKGLQDALQMARVFEDDSQIDVLLAFRMSGSSSPGGRCIVWLGSPSEVLDVVARMFTGDCQWI